MVSVCAPCRGFTTLSATLGHLVIALHNGLLHAIANETQIPALVNMLKTFETLMLSAAYNRLPPDLLTRCIEVSLHFQSHFIMRILLATGLVLVTGLSILLAIIQVYNHTGVGTDVDLLFMLQDQAQDRYCLNSTQ